MNAPHLQQPVSVGHRHRFRRIKEHVLGPLISILLHVLLVALAVSLFALSEREEEDPLVIVLDQAEQMDFKLDPPMDPLDPPEDDTDNPIPNDVMMPDDTIDHDMDLDEYIPSVLENDSPLTLQGFEMFMDNDVTSDQLSRSKGSAFGYGKHLKGDLTGVMYDLKRDRSKRPRACDYANDVREMVDKGLTKRAFRPFYKVPRELYFTHLFVPYTEAEAGPEAFGVSDLMEPRQWVVHYSGHIQSLWAGKHRFVGEFDDLLLVLVDGKVVLESFWGESITGWRPSEYVDAHKSFTTKALAYGDWFEMESLEPVRVDILVGENPGGSIGGTLLVQHEGHSYDTAVDGRPILPVFAVQPLTPAEQAKLQSFTEWKFEARTPIMGFRHERRYTSTEDDDEIEVVVQ